MIEESVLDTAHHVLRLAFCEFDRRTATEQGPQLSKGRNGGQLLHIPETNGKISSQQTFKTSRLF